MLGKAHSTSLGVCVSTIPLSRAFPGRLDARVSVIPLSKGISRHPYSRVSAILLEKTHFKCLVARVIVFLPGQSLFSRLGAHVSAICRLMFSLDSKTSPNLLEGGPFRASLFQHALPHGNEVLFE
jgi:hypothetical protein